MPAAVTRLPALRVLDLGGSALAEVPAGLLELTTLEELDLGGALSDVRELPELSRLPRLRVLRMSGTGRPGLHLLDGVWAITTLEELTIDRWNEKTRNGAVIRPGLTALPDDAFARMPGLRRLDLSFNRVTTLPASFYELAHLEFVDLRHTALDAATLDRIGERLPRVRMDLRDIGTRAKSDDPTRLAVQELVKRATAELASAPDAAIALFEEAIARCVPGARHADRDRLSAHSGIVDAIGRLDAMPGGVDEARVDTLIRHAELALDLVPHPALVWHVTDEGAFHREVNRRVGNALAWHLMERGDLDRALLTVERALLVAEGAKHDFIRDTKVRILLAMDRSDEAYPIVDSVLTRDPDSTDFADLGADPDFARWRLVNVGAERPSSAADWVSGNSSL